MRNIIYSELLIFKEPSGSAAECHPAVLSACRQTYYEARDILYEEIDYDIGFTYLRNDAGSYMPEATCAPKKQPSRLDTTKLRSQAHPWPGWLLLPKTLRLTIGIKNFVLKNSTDGLRIHWAVKRSAMAIHDLIQFLHSSAELRTLHVVLDCDDVLLPEQVLRLLKPIKLLAAVKIMSYTGNSAQLISTMPERLMLSSPAEKPSTSVLRQYRKVAGRARDTIGLAKRYDCKPGRIIPIKKALLRGDEALDGGSYLGANTDDMLKAIVEELEQLLEKEVSVSEELY